MSWGRPLAQASVGWDGVVLGWCCGRMGSDHFSASVQSITGQSNHEMFGTGNFVALLHGKGTHNGRCPSEGFGLIGL